MKKGIIENVSVQMGELFEVGLNESSLAKFDELKGILDESLDVARVDFHTHAPELYVNLGKIPHVELPSDSYKEFFSKCENAKKLTGFRDEYKRLNALSSKTRDYLRNHSIPLGYGSGFLMTKASFEDFFSYFQKVDAEWKDVVEQIRDQYDDFLVEFREKVEFAINNIYVKGGDDDKIKLRNEMLSELYQATSQSKELFCSKIYLELSTGFKEESFNDKELKDFIRESARKEQLSIIRGILEELLKKAFSDTSLYLNAVARCTGDDIFGILKTVNKYKRSISELSTMNIYEFAVISAIVSFEKKISRMTDKYDICIALMDLLSWIYQHSAPYGISLDLNALPQTDTLSMSIDSLETPVSDDFLDVYNV